MTRDPSDGSVKEITPDAKENKAIAPKQGSEEITSGLREPGGKRDYLERLERSRDWLSKYRTDPEGALRRMGETDWVNPETGQTDLLND